MITPPEQRQPVNGKHILIVLAVIALGAWWWSGSLDVPLSSVGLNKNACVKGIAGTYCGDDAEALCRGIASGSPACESMGVRTEDPYADDEDGDGISDRHDQIFNPDG